MFIEELSPLVRQHFPWEGWRSCLSWTLALDPLEEGKAVPVCTPTHPALCPGLGIGVTLPQGDIFPWKARGTTVLVMPLHIAGCMVLPRSAEPGFPGLHKLLSLS